MKKTWDNQIFMFRFCIKSVPKYFLFHLLMCIGLEVFVFLEHTLWIGYNLKAAETGEAFRHIAILTAGMILLLLLHQLISATYFYWATIKIKPILYHKLRKCIYKKAQEVDLACYDNPDYYNEFILSTTQADQCVDRFYEDSYYLTRYTTCLLIDFIYLSVNSKMSLLVVLICFFIKLWASKKYYKLSGQRKINVNYCERKRAYQHRVFYLQDYAKELKLHKEMQAKLMQDFEECNAELKRNNQYFCKKLFLYGFLKDYISGYFVLYAIYLPVLLWMVIERKQMAISEMIVLVNLVRYMSRRGNSLAQLGPQMAMNSSFIGKIREFLRYEAIIVSGSKKVDEELKTVSLQHVSFSYTPDGKEILHDINMELKKGQKIAIVGYNGAGKSTLTKLLMRLYDPKEGTIFRNGEDIRNLDLQQYRENIGTVFQDYKIYAASLCENVVMNICTGDKKETYEVEKALFDAQFTLTDEKLKYQIETPLTTEFEKDGVNLSGGEAQKVAIARTLYRQHDLIIMDEPSSALDPLSEYQMNVALQEIAADKTVVFISHRLSTTRDADHIYMMEQGRIIEQGTHEQLLRLHGKYSQMWYAQAKNYQEFEREC